MALPGPGRCAMRGACGKKGIFGTSLPCPADNSPAEEPSNRDLLVQVCGPDYAQGAACCTSEQLETLQSSLNQAEGIIASCPACRNNFRQFFCSFTCSPDQSTFVNVTSTQTLPSGNTAVASVDFVVAPEFGQGFFDSCKSIQNGASNSYAMDLIGGGAKSYPEFFKFLGDEKSIGSPFQIDFPASTPPDMDALNPTPRSCSDNDLGSRCTCIDCPDICQALPYVPPPSLGPACHVGLLSCLSFILVLAYSIAVVSFILGFVLQVTIRRRREKVYERMALSSETASLSPRSHTRGLVGAGSLSLYLDGDDSLAGHSTEGRNLGRGASLLDPTETVQPRQYKLNIVMRRAFYRLGLCAASYPWFTFAVVFALVGVSNIGWKHFEVETNPVRLWVAPTSESKVHKDFFDEHFGPFYRTEQVFVTSHGKPEEPVLSWEHLKYWFDVEAEIRALTSPENGYTLEDVCFKPAGPEGACVVQSVAAWFDNSLEEYTEETWASRINGCAHTPVDCLPDFMQPLGPQYVLGGVPEGPDGGKSFLGAEAMVINYVVAASTDPVLTEKAMEWERELRAYLVDLSIRAPMDAGLQIAFSTEISLEEEINKSTNTDVKIVVLSYIAMFLYISLTLGSGGHPREEEGVVSSLMQWARNLPRLFTGGGLASSSISVDSRTTPRFFPHLPRSLFTGSKFTLGLFGISLVILAVASSIGLFSAMGVKVTLIIAEVIPFLVLAVGVDNVFILVHELDRQNSLHGPNASAASQSNLTSSNPMSPTQSRRPPFEVAHEQEESVDAASMPVYLSAEERVARTLAKMGPSILLSTISEVLAFSLGAVVPMPAVRNFALYAAGSVLLNAIMQITVFISALTLDLRRVESNRVDCFPCIRLPGRIALSEREDNAPPGAGLGTIGKFIRRYYAPFLLKPVVKGVVLLTFAGIFVASVISMQHIELGLDQRLALPAESYLIPYFDNLAAYLDVGPPVYFVSHDVDVKKRSGQQALCGRFTTCQDFSVANVLEAERKRPESSFISEPTAGWIDDFLSFLNPSQGDCCRVRKRDPTIFCSEGDSPRACQPCLSESRWNITMEGLPEDEEFMRYLQQWLVTPTTAACPLAGKASFGTALALSKDKADVTASHFRTFHSPLKTQADFINAFEAGHRVAADISKRMGVTVFPYSVFYVFFDQYSHVIAITQEILGLGLASVLIVTALMLGSWRTGTIVAGVVGLTVVAVMGAMEPLGVSLNAISLVNLVISLGIAVEFCAHIARAFMSAGNGLPADHPAGQKERDDRMWIALVDVGPSVLSGITFTKLIGMSVLGLTRSRLLEIYYFRMWLTLIVSGALHGLILLPVVLSLAGGSGFSQQELDEEWMSHAIRSEYEYAPFLADDDSVSSD